MLDGARSGGVEHAHKGERRIEAAEHCLAALEESLRVVEVDDALRVEGLPVVDREASLAAAERVAAITKALAVRAVALHAHHVCIESVPIERAKLIERGRRRREVGDAINVRAHRMANDVGEQLRAFW